MKKVFNIIISIIFIIWFIGSIYLLTTFAKQEKYGLILVIFGQVFFVFGLIFIKKMFESKQILKDLILLIFPIVGLGAMIIGLGINFNTEFIKKYAFLSVPIIFFTIGLVGLIGITLQSINKKKNCTYKIKGKIIREDKIYDYDSGSYSYKPIYAINYNNETLILSEEIYSIKDYDIGEERELLINPTKPNEFIDFKRKNLGFAYMISIISLITGIVTFIIILLQTK
ncbi:MAG: hypothetical protein E7160_02740 [Firmicutes bacterium]|nr:hypothetical protein [Bacillota bacterium]